MLSLLLRSGLAPRTKLFMYAEYSDHVDEGLMGNDTPGVGSTNSATMAISDHDYSRLQRNV
eukprot:CAMPEP_0173435784 /NCGR_PEP_ID=MMETSP1357-20121228/15588_1 /TAXON_ID=77926 /ORGANISM="Hemiselmis rufescens, Strain PCC563" /LENGTH=60 /DNA_ID=CAMNT_0014400809 /DNA_START=12 /DNA_END=194 /DNA_ORIENTATION=+